jgi:hypothetical protein
VWGSSHAEVLRVLSYTYSFGFFGWQLEIFSLHWFP